MDFKHEFSIQTLRHYQDNFLKVAYQSRSSAQCQLYIILEVFHYFGITIAEEKIEGPNQILIFLGIELDTLCLEACLPDDKLAELKQHLSNLLQSGHTTAGSLDKFLGKLSFALRVVVPGCTFTCCLWD